MSSYTQNSIVIILSAALGMAAAAPQFQLPAGIQLPPGINTQNCPNFPFCTNNLAALAQGPDSIESFRLDFQLENPLEIPI